jgi:hypothetical protein
MPSYSHALAGFPCGDALAHDVDASHYLVSGNARVLNAGKRSLLGERVTVADATSFYSDSDRSEARVGNFAFD